MYWLQRNCWTLRPKITGCGSYSGFEPGNLVAARLITGRLFLLSDEDSERSGLQRPVRKRSA
jgi:hypothetical protein